MIESPINELTVFADKLEDEEIDVSLLRYLCSYNYICVNLADGANTIYEAYDTYYDDFVHVVFYGDGDDSDSDEPESENIVNGPFDGCTTFRGRFIDQFGAGYLDDFNFR